MLIDNRRHGTVQEALDTGIKKGGRLSCLSGDFSVHAYFAVKQALERTALTRLLLPEQSGEDHLRLAVCINDGEADRRLRNRLDTAAVARRCTKWIEERAEVRSTKATPAHNLFYAGNADGTKFAVHGSSALTTSGLGVVTSNAYLMNTLVQSDAEAAQLLEWFNAIWDEAAEGGDAKASLLDHLHDLYSTKAPELIYFLTLHNLFQDYLGELDEENIIKTRTGIKDTRVWNKLYRFQRDGVLGAIDKIERFNGCILADSVGLGKTFEALAIIKYYELRNDRVLVLAPKKLRENWALYTVNDTRNLLAEDRFNFDVLNHTDLSREGGMSGEINLETVNWGNYDLVVIDESHNFRNNPPRKDGLTRYGRLMRDIIQAGVKTKVLMLSATPVNNRMNDLKNQIAFITEGRDDALYPEGIASIDTTLGKAQRRFNAWLRESDERRKTGHLLEALNFDYFSLLDRLTIARSRKHIEKYYDMGEIGAFPRRRPPRNLYPPIDLQGQFPELREINRDIRRLHLSAYAPLRYVLPEKLEEYSRKYDMQVSGGSIFKQKDREESLIHLMRVNMLKRMESSIHAFALTVEKLLGGVRDLKDKLDNHDATDIEEWSIEGIEVEDEAFDPYLVGNKVKVLIQDVDRVRWRQDLEEDEAQLVKLLREARDVSAERDAKLEQLKEQVREKGANPFNPGNNKVLVFTAFADTAEYLYGQIADWALETLGLRAGKVTGHSHGNRSTVPGLRRDIPSILTAFSPLSKERGAEGQLEIDILIATDCISEGQNLQDCDFLVNYDIHWNPVRIIQRFGRIDRLGSRNEVIQLTNFWPNLELDEYIDLEARVAGRMVLLDISATGEENVIEYAEGDAMNDLEYRRRQLHQLQNDVPSIEDLSDGISITDLTLNDYRMDLGEYLKQHGEQLERMSLGAFAVTTIDDLIESEDLGPGAIFCLRNMNARVHGDPTYPLAPHYLVYVGDNGEVRLNCTHTRRVLDQLKRLTLGRSRPDERAVSRLNHATSDGWDMAHYRALLAQAVAAVTGKAEERGVESLFEPGGTVISRDSFQGMDDFEVVSYLIVLDGAGAN
ncbi:helicase [Spiribacter vilamensis]|uniref:SNF2 domain-containing protein n=1 Tax=Spiribacter vilamensis TaxID=531306 RepID=A0A4Q8D0C9_9GAMM|nr:SNF2 domain-containing protein [Spiribacter vilamensis]TVO62252.1 helicase [Spiribacter vilamensis]